MREGGREGGSEGGGVRGGEGQTLRRRLCVATAATSLSAITMATKWIKFPPSRSLR